MNGKNRDIGPDDLLAIGAVGGTPARRARVLLGDVKEAVAAAGF